MTAHVPKSVYDNTKTEQDQKHQLKKIKTHKQSPGHVSVLNHN